MFYFVKSPLWLQKLYGNCIWKMQKGQKIIYLSFDDGPHPTATPFVLNELKKFDAKATFFCIGKNVVEHPEVYKQILLNGHSVGNHTHNHYNGWKTPDEIYMKDISEAQKHIDTVLFRPPYGRITHFQIKLLQKPAYKLKPVMWSVLSGDFDENLSVKKCLKNVLNNTTDGDIVVFHDSAKAFGKLVEVLPVVLEFFANKGYKFGKL